MNEQPARYLVPGLEVTFIAQDKKPHKGRITEVFHQGAARIESLDGKATAVAQYSETEEVNTFRFPASSTASEENGKTTRGKQAKEN
jgi:hypothetical protein